jgi:hypothetical protein
MEQIVRFLDISIGKIEIQIMEIGRNKDIKTMCFLGRDPSNYKGFL